MENIFRALVGLIMSLTSAFIPGQKPVTQVTPTAAIVEVTSTMSPTPTETASPSAVPTAIVTRIPVPTKVVVPTKMPTPTMDLAKNEACNKLNLPIHVFSGMACLPKDLSLPGPNRECWNNKEPGKFCAGMEVNWESEVIKHDLDKVRNRILAQCQKVSIGDFTRCNESIISHAGRLTEEIGKGIDNEVNACFEGVNPNLKGPLKSQTETYIKKNKLKQKLEDVYNFCFSHGYTVNDLRY